MTFETQLKIQACLDGELSASEAREVAALLERDADAAALHAELQRARRAMAGLEEPRSLPEPREFYWGKIRSEIERAAPAPAPAATSWRGAWRMWLRPVGVLSAVVLVAMLVLWPQERGSASAAMVAAFNDSGAVTFRDESSGTTFVWFTFPSENGFAEAGAPATLDTP